MSHHSPYYTDAAAGLLLTVGALVVYRDSYNIKVIAQTTLDAAFFPRFLAVGVILLSLLMVAKAARGLRREAGGTGAEKPSLAAALKENLPALATLALFGLYVFSIEGLGFLISTAVYIFGQFCILAPAGQRRYPVFALLGAAASAVIYCVFKFGFQLLVPPGILG